MRAFPSTFVRAGLAVVLLSGLGCRSSSSAGSAGGEGGANPASLPSTASLSAFLNGFEGEIDVDAKHSKAGAPAQDIPLAVFVKSGKLRIDLPDQLAQSGGPIAMLGPKAYGIYESAAKKLYAVSDARKEVIVVDLDKSGQQLQSVGKPPTGLSAPGKAAGGPPTKVTRTGKYDTVAGYKCENWDIASDHREATACVADEGVSWLSLPITGVPTERAWALELMDGKHFPLRFVSYDKDGNTEDGRVEVTKIDKKTLQASEFEYPPTYKVVDLAQMMAGFAAFGAMGGMPRGMPAGFPGMAAGRPMAVQSPH
jgi:Domain of unknown function (DUF4412)